jgi:hypothetical protein
MARLVECGDRDARVGVEVTPGERFLHMIETFFGLARLGHTDSKGMPYPLQAALTARSFSDVIVFRSPPLAVQRPILGALAPRSRTSRFCERPASRSSNKDNSWLAYADGSTPNAPSAPPPARRSSRALVSPHIDSASILRRAPLRACQTPPRD